MKVFFSCGTLEISLHRIRIHFKSSNQNCTSSHPRYLKSTSGMPYTNLSIMNFARGIKNFLVWIIFFISLFIVSSRALEGANAYLQKTIWDHRQKRGFFVWLNPFTWFRHVISDPVLQSSLENNIFFRKGDNTIKFFEEIRYFLHLRETYERMQNVLQVKDIFFIHSVIIIGVFASWLLIKVTRMLCQGQELLSYCQTCGNYDPGNIQSPFKRTSSESHTQVPFPITSPKSYSQVPCERIPPKSHSQIPYKITSPKSHSQVPYERTFVKSHRQVPCERTFLKSLNRRRRSCSERGIHKQITLPLIEYSQIQDFIGEKIGEGSYARVYDMTGEYADSCIKIFWETMQAFLRQEMQCLLALQGIEGICELRGITQSPSAFIMKRYEMTLLNWLYDNIKPIKDVLQVFVDLCEIMEKVHKKGFCHNDLKENNIMINITEEGPKVTVIDFGISTKIGDIPFPRNFLFNIEKKILMNWKKTYFYAPCLYLGGPASPSTDTYALALLMKKALSFMSHKGDLMDLLNEYTKGDGSRCDLQKLMSTLKKSIVDEKSDEIMVHPKFLDFTATAKYLCFAMIFVGLIGTLLTFLLNRGRGDR